MLVCIGQKRMATFQTLQFVKLLKNEIAHFDPKPKQLKSKAVIDVSGSLLDFSVIWASDIFFKILFAEHSGPTNTCCHTYILRNLFYVHNQFNWTDYILKDYSWINAK